MEKLRSIFLLAVLGCTTIATYGNTFEYDWTGGKAGFAGQIFLDASSSPPGGGSIANIVSGSITTPTMGTVSINLASATLLDPIFTWTPTGITEMYLRWRNQPYPGYPHQDLGEIAQNCLGLGGLRANFLIRVASGVDIDTHPGAWLAAVPETGGTSVMLLLSLAALATVERFRFRCAR